MVSIQPSVDTRPKPRLQIVRGLPGSGKSTYANSRWPHILRYEFDFYCMRGGRYVFDDVINADGQRWLSDVVSKALALGIDLVVCGVFAGKTEHLDDLVNEALSHGYHVWIETLSEDYGNIHGVSQSDLESMNASFVPTEIVRERFPDDVRFGSMPTGFSVCASVQSELPAQDAKGVNASDGRFVERMWRVLDWASCAVIAVIILMPLLVFLFGKH